jgi:hypothetical protein
MKPRYIHLLSQYNRVLDQRNRLLKDIAYQPVLQDTLDIWDARLASFAAVLIKTRASFINRLLPYAQEVYAGISRKETLDFLYISLFCDLHAAFRHRTAGACLSAGNRQEDIQAVLLHGPHRTTSRLRSAAAARAVCFPGTAAKLCALAEAAEFELIRETTGISGSAVDEVMSEVMNPAGLLLNHLRGRQVLITCCDERILTTWAGLGVRLGNGAVTSTSILKRRKMHVSSSRTGDSGAHRGIVGIFDLENTSISKITRSFSPKRTGGAGGNVLRAAQILFICTEKENRGLYHADFLSTLPSVRDLSKESPILTVSKSAYKLPPAVPAELLKIA